jgi:serine O-acetyltransferase
MMRLLRFLHLILCCPLWGLYFCSSRKAVIAADVTHWSRRHKRTGSFAYQLSFLFTNCVFRSVFYYRLNSGGIGEKIVWRMAAILYPREPTLLIYTREIGPGLFVQHGLSTIIAARKIGRNCTVHQQVTIGYTNDTDAPEIGDDVFVGCGAKILGSVRIGDRVRIGANAVVIKNVPDDCTAVGVPARLLPQRAPVASC